MQKVLIKTKEQIKGIEQSSNILAKTLEDLSKKVVPGVSTLDLENYARKKIKEHGATPAFLNYKPHGAKRPYPAALCVSINNEVVHGIPNEKPKILNDGDIVTLDLGVNFKGFFSDSAITVPVGKIDDNAKKLLKATKEALSEAIKIAKPGKKTGDIGFAIEKVARKYGFSSAKDLGGHGVGIYPHEDPFIPNWDCANQGVVLEEGMVLAIEPMLNEKSGEVKILSDGYTFVTKDGGRSAHFEHTVVINKKTTKILTFPH